MKKLKNINFEYFSLAIIMLFGFFLRIYKLLNLVIQFIAYGGKIIRMMKRDLKFGEKQIIPGLIIFIKH